MLTLLLSLHFFVLADWPMVEADRQYVETVVVHAAHERLLEDLAFARIEINLDPISSPEDWGDFEIVLHDQPFYSEWFPGVPLSGLYSPPETGRSTPRIDLEWPKERAAGGTWDILAHELGHYYLMVNAKDWEYFMHGLNAPAGRDAYLNRLLDVSRAAYPAGHSSDPIRRVGP